MAKGDHVLLLSMGIQSRRDVDMLEEAVRKFLCCQSAFCPVLQSDIYRKMRSDLLNGTLARQMTLDLGQCLQLRVRRGTAEVYDVGILLPTEDSRVLTSETDASEPKAERPPRRTRSTSPDPLSFPRPTRKRRNGYSNRGPRSQLASGTL